MSLLTLSFLMMSASAMTQDRVVTACETWLADRHQSQVSGDTHAVGEDGLCFDGQIDSASANRFIAMTRTMSAATHPVVVVRSVGGDVDAGIAMGNAIHRLGATVVAKTLCVSSCANYLIGGAKVRIVLPGTLLGFHGGALHTPITVFEKTLRTQKMADASTRAQSAFAKSEANVRLQAAFLAANRIDPTIFDWMDRFNALSSQRKRAICPDAEDGLGFLVFAPGLLARHRLPIQDYRGPESDAAVDAALAKLGLPAAMACYIDAEEGEF